MQALVNWTLSETLTLKRVQDKVALYHLAESIRKNKLITGILIGENKEHELALYVNNMIVFLTNINKPLSLLMKEIGKYSSFSGYK